MLKIQVGGSYRTYNLNSDGSIFTDRGSTIDYSEYGLYMQAQRKFGEKLKFTGSIRYDGAQNYDANYSPRVSFVWTPDEAQKACMFSTFLSNGIPLSNNTEPIYWPGNSDCILLGSASDNYDRYRTTERENNVAAALQAAFQL